MVVRAPRKWPVLLHWHGHCCMQCVQLSPLSGFAVQKTLRVATYQSIGCVSHRLSGRDIAFCVGISPAFAVERSAPRLEPPLPHDTFAVRAMLQKKTKTKAAASVPTSPKSSCSQEDVSSHKAAAMQRQDSPTRLAAPVSPPSPKRQSSSSDTRG